jgi:HK97 family phage portal protein
MPITADGEYRALGEEQRTFTGWPWDTGGPPPYVAIGVQRALSLVPCWGAARILGDMISSLTPALYTKSTDGVWNRIDTPSLFVNPSVHGTLMDWLQRGVHSMVLQGDAVGYVTQRNYYDIPTMIEFMNPEEVTCMDGSQGNASYNADNGAGYNTSAFTGPGSYIDPIWYWRGRVMDKRDVFHVPWFTMPWKVRGLSPIGAYQTVANAGLGAQDFASAWYLNGGHPPGVLQNTTQQMTKEDADTITARVTNRLQQRKPLVFGSDWMYTPISMKMADAAFVETAQLTANHLAVIYGLPPEKLGGQTGGPLTYNTVVMNALDFLVNSLRPWLVRWEQALSALFPRGTFVKFDPEDMLRMDPLSKAQYDNYRLGYYPPPQVTQDEVRRSNDLPPMGGAAGLLVPPYRPGAAGAGGETDPADDGTGQPAAPPEPKAPAPGKPLDSDVTGAYAPPGAGGGNGNGNGRSLEPYGPLDGPFKLLELLKSGPYGPVGANNGSPMDN